MVYIVTEVIFFFFLNMILFIYLFIYLERLEGKEKKRERNIDERNID